MRTANRFFPAPPLALLLGLALLSCAAHGDQTGGSLAPASQEQSQQLAEARNRTLGRGMNFGNALEAPTEGEWGLTIKEEHVQAVAEAGFDSVRLPICWSAHLADKPPYQIDSRFLKRVDEVVEWSLRRGLAVIIAVHHFNALYDEPDRPENRERLLSLWRQLSMHYQNREPERLFFELLNEPHNQLTAAKWTALMPSLIAAVRTTDAGRTLILDAPEWAYHGALSKLEIPESERNVIVSVRYYQPYDFTHQGAHWAEGSDRWLGLTWTGTAKQKALVESDLRMIKAWSEKHRRPITIGEFGAIARVDSASRLIWTQHVTRSFEAQGFSWSYFDFGVIFRAYDLKKKRWLDGFSDALVPGGNTRLGVTAIANAGFLFEGGGKKVLIDAIFSKKNLKYGAPAPELLEQITAGREPFDNVDLLLLSHHHNDHFDAKLVAAFLRNNPRAMVVAHRQTVDVLRKIEGFEAFANRIREVAPEPGESTRVEVAGIVVDAICLFHAGGPRGATKNLAFSATLGGVRFLDPGDAALDQNVEELRAFPFESLRTDVLIIEYFDRSPTSQTLIRERIRPGHIVAMHVPPADFAQVAREVRAIYPSAFLLEMPMERHRFKAGADSQKPPAESIR